MSNSGIIVEETGRFVIDYCLRKLVCRSQAVFIKLCSRHILTQVAKLHVLIVLSELYKYIA